MDIFSNKIIQPSTRNVMFAPPPLPCIFDGYFDQLASYWKKIN
jgi:hypothetical protein